MIELEYNITFRDKKGRNITIRMADKNDKDKLVDMYLHFHPDDRCLGLPPISKPAIETWIEFVLDCGYSLVAEYKGKIVGHVSVIPAGNGTGELCIFVLRGYQNVGIGQTLLKSMIDVAKKLQFRGIYLTTARCNIRAIHVFKKVGFKVVDSCYDYEMYLPLDGKDVC